VLDVGCGPGHVGRYLADQGVDTSGVDLSPEMARRARQLNPTLSCTVADLRALPIRDAGAAGIVAFYSLIHLPRSDLLDAFRELRRVLRDGAPLLVAVHGGVGGLHTDEFLGHAVAIDVTLIERNELAALLEAGGFRVDRVEQRAPYPFEHPTDRLYGLARAGGSGPVTPAPIRSGGANAGPR
jgi:SAM-dependent methyltransferase